MSENPPWDDWVPGVLSYRQVKELIDKDYIRCDSKADFELDHSSLDLTLSDEVYELPSGSVKPFGGRYLNEIKSKGLARKKEANNGIYQLLPKQTYLIRLNEKISSLRDTCIYGQSTAKSTIGRMDVLARLIVDGMYTYEEFSPDKIDNGEMYLEVTPITFGVKVKPGISLTQLRFFKGPPYDSEIKSPSFFQTIIRYSSGNTDGSLSLDTSPIEIKCGDKTSKASAFRSKLKKEEKPEFIQLWESKHTSPSDYWDIVEMDEYERIKIEPGKFYIMRSHERIAVPKGVAVYCRAIDETIGEMRIHYAGFAHPFFGCNEKGGLEGTPLVFEVRGHDVNVSLGPREKMAKLIFYRMSEDANLSDKPIDSSDPYQRQTLQLSKFFKNWE